LIPENEATAYLLGFALAVLLFFWTCRKPRHQYPAPTGLLEPVTGFMPSFGDEVKFYKYSEPYYWMRVTPGPRRKRAHGPFALPCHTLCHFHMARPHLTCLHCKLRRVESGEMPDTILVELYTLAIWLDRPHARLKSWLLKPVLSIAELLAG